MHSLSPFSHERLPYAMNALAPHISEETLIYHYGKHHLGYVNALEALVKDTPQYHASLVQIIQESIIPAKASAIHDNNIMGKIFNNAAQIWNHDFYWHSLCPVGEKHECAPELMKAIVRDCGSYEKLCEIMAQKGIEQFASGWVWLVADKKGHLHVERTSNAMPIWCVNSEYEPLLVCDVWEHAYYIDFRNARKTYLDTIAPLFNLGFASKNYVQRPLTSC